ncbi:hypothetical protein OA93_00230 [Flavobacterium sp. KMS]|uniref:T9SS type A sorting domain-containing protein n=1 Tax=Flavobacterium sp. KMS TaxID=1566023 RepID=UPI00057EA161|nr:T9SS type A sorting domain-containing protein [Flavobacterium sp. KMS]KIC00080.1 hypothetical protein OA93_00230 [Flavobacterium sp. KMS]
MRKKYFYFVLTLLFSTTILFGQKVTLTPLLVNGKGYTTGPINLESTPVSSVSLSVKVDSPGATGNDGTITVYYINPAALGGNVASGGNGGPLLFGGGKTATRNFVISLNWSNFNTSGGYVYAEYKNSAGVIYKSASLSVIKNATMGGGTLTPPADAPNPANIANSLCCNQTVRLGERPAPIVGSQYANPYKDYNYGINSSWSASGNSSIKLLSTENHTLNMDYITELKNFTVSRSLGYNNTVNLTNKSNTVTVTVVPSPIAENEISIDAGIDGNGFAEIINTNPKIIQGSQTYVNLNTLQDPFNIPKRTDTRADIERYEWEYGLTNNIYPIVNNWTTLPNENSVSLNSLNIPNLNSSEDNFYLIRRIAIYKNLKIASNSLKITLRTVRNNNTICCDQTLQISTSNVIESPSLITGATAISDKNQYLYYQWQSQSTATRLKPSGNWSNIKGATSKDYFPPPLQFVPNSGGRDGSETTIPTYNYRRIVESNIYNTEKSYSNEVNLTYKYPGRETSSSLTIYPNPATSTINIKNTNARSYTYGDPNLTNATVNIINIMGTIVNSNNFSIVDPSLITIDISTLITGTYFLNISGNSSDGIPYTKQFTFIKN